MRIFWLNGGLQLQPETDVEAEAMLVLMARVKLEVPSEDDTPRLVPRDSGQVERGLDLDL